MAKMLAPNTTIWFVKAVGTFNPLVPTVAALLVDIGASTAINLSAAIASGYTLNPTDSDTDDSKTIVDETNTSSRGAANYECTLPFYREADIVANPTSDFQIAWELFKTKGVYGTVLRRVGKKYLTAPVAADLIDIFTVLSDNARDIEADSGGPYQFEVPFFSQGYVNMNEPLA